MNHEHATRSDLRIAVQNADLGGTWTAQATRADLLATLSTLRRTLRFVHVDNRGAPIGGGAVETAPAAIAPDTTCKGSVPVSLGNASSLGELIAAAIDAAAKAGQPAAPSIDADAIERIAALAAEEYCEAAGLNRPLTFPMPDLGRIGTVTGRTVKGFERIRKSLLVEKVALLVGPTGSGKTHAAEQLAAALDVPFYAVSCSGGMSESWLVGRVLADGRYVETPFVTAWRDGGLFLLDEFGACPDDVAIVANAAISNGILVIPSTGERIARNARNFIVAADNSWGRVYSAEYSARSVRDLATSNRFATSQFSIGYDASMERKLARDILGKDRIDAADAIVDCMLALRRGALAAAIERWAVSTRQIVNAAKHVAADAATLREVVERMILPLADDEIERLWAESGPEAKPWETAEPSAEPSAEPIA